MVIDSLILMTFTTTLISILNAIVPETQIQPMSMQLMPEKMLKVFFYTMFFTTGAILLYVLLAPLSRWQGTLGHLVAKIQLVTLTGQKVSWLDNVRRVWVTAVRASMVFFAGPILAVLEFEVIYSVLALLWGLILILPIPIRRSPETLTLWQLLGNYKFVERN